MCSVPIVTVYSPPPQGWTPVHSQAREIEAPLRPTGEHKASAPVSLPQPHGPRKGARASTTSHEYATGKAMEESCHDGARSYYPMPQAQRHGLPAKDFNLVIIAGKPAVGHASSFAQRVPLLKPDSLTAHWVDPCNDGRGNGETDEGAEPSRVRGKPTSACQDVLAGPYPVVLTWRVYHAMVITAMPMCCEVAFINTGCYNTRNV
jgi:hypothetical protein